MTYESLAIAAVFRGRRRYCGGNEVVLVGNFEVVVAQKFNGSEILLVVSVDVGGCALGNPDKRETGTIRISPGSCDLR